MSADKAPSARIAWYQRDWPWLAVILLAGALLRCWYLTELPSAPDFTALRQDLDVQDYQARAMISGDWTVREGETDPEIPTTPYYRPPGYTYYLAVLYFFSSGSYWAPRIANMLMGLVTAVLMYRLGKKLYGRLTGLITAFFLSTYWAFIYYEGEVNDPCLFVFLAACLLLTIQHWRQKPSFLRAASAGLIIGSYALMRPNILLFGPVLAAWMGWVAWQQRQRHRIIASWMGLALAAFLVIMPVTIRNYRVSGEWVPISTYFGENFLIGNGEDSDGVTSWTPYLQDLEGTGNWNVWVYINVIKGLSKELGREISHSEASDYFFNKTIDFIKTHKRRTFNLAIKKAILFWSPKEITENKVVQGEKDFYPPLKYLPGFAWVMALWTTGSFSLFLDRRKRTTIEPASNATSTEMTWIIFAFILVYFASFIPFFVNARARVPILGVCLMIGAYGISRWWTLLRERRIRSALAGAALFGILLAAASYEYIPYSPDMCRWHYDRADSYLRIGEVEKAISESQKMMALPQRPMTYMPYRLGHAFAALNKPEIALPLLQAAFSPNPEDQNPRYREDLHYHVGALLTKLNRGQEAKKEFENALALNPDDGRAHNDLALLLEKDGDWAAAEMHYREAIRAYPLFGLALSNLGDLLARQNRLDECIALYRKAILSEPDQSDFHYNLARHLTTAGYNEQAIAEYRKAIELDPDDPRPHNNLALLLAKRGQIEDARGHFEEAIRLRPDFSLAFANLGDLYQQEGRTHDALAMYEKGLLAKPDDAGLHHAAGYLYAQQNNFPKAWDHYREAVRLAPEYASAYNSMGNLSAQQGDWTKAEEFYRQALDKNPKEPHAALNRAAALVQLGRLDDAIAQFNAVVTQDPSNAAALTGLANTLAQRGRLDEAVTAYRQALQIDPDLLDAQVNLGIVLSALHRPDEARQAWEAALQQKPDYPPALEQLQRLKPSQP